LMAAVHHRIDRSRIFNSQRSGHGPNLPPPRVCVISED
jgi:hypothetical protein